MIAAKVANALALDYPRERLQVIVASDGSADATAERARAAGADLVLELPRGGKIAAQNAAAERAGGEILAFSDANSVWAPDALRHLVEPFADPGVGYACGQVRFLDAGGDNLEGAYWRYEMAVREMESALAGVTAGNGAIYAVRREAYLPLAAVRQPRPHLPLPAGQARPPLALPARGPRRGEDGADAGGRVARKRRMMVGLWDIVVGEGMLSPRGYPPPTPSSSSRTGCCATDPAAAPRRLRRQPRPARQAGSTPHPRRPARPARGGALGGVLPLAPLRSPATTLRPRPRSPSASSTSARHGAPGAGRRPRGRGWMPRALRHLVAVDRAGRLSPVLLVAAIAIKSAPRPGLYRQRRVGRDGPSSSF